MLTSCFVRMPQLSCTRSPDYITSAVAFNVFTFTSLNYYIHIRGLEDLWPQGRMLRTPPCFLQEGRRSRHGAKHSPPGLEKGYPKGWIRGGYQNCYKKVTFHRFSDVNTIATQMATVVSNVSKVADSISVLDSFLTRRCLMTRDQLLTSFLWKSQNLHEIDRLRSRD